MGLFDRHPAARYEFSRLCFKADVIEALRDRDTFEVVTPLGTFRMTKADFYRDFSNVVRSRSYQEAGIYHYPTVPRKALPYLKWTCPAGTDAGFRLLSPLVDGAAARTARG